MKENIPINKHINVQPLFTWLHLSDIHIGHGDAQHKWDQKLVLKQLKIDIYDAKNRGVPKINAVLVTGDLAFSGGVKEKSEYKQVKEFLTEIGEITSVSSNKIFVVPGNHDVQRNIEIDDPDGMQTLLKLRSGEQHIDKSLSDKKERKFLTSRISNYLNFAKDFAPFNSKNQKEESLLYWSQKLTLNDGYSIILVGLNTTLLATKEPDEYGDFNRLQLGKEQLANTFSNLPIDNKKEIVIALSHHPFNWLFDGDYAIQTLKQYAHIHLCGHVHDAKTEQQRSGAGTDIVSIVAGATHDEARKDNVPLRHGYNISTLYQDTRGKILLRVYPRIWSKNHDFRIDKDSLPKVNKDNSPYKEDWVEHELGNFHSSVNITNVNEFDSIVDSNIFQCVGGLTLGHPTYIERDCDNYLKDYIKEKSLISVVGHNQLGKTSLLNQTFRYIPLNWKCCYIDLQRLRVDNQNLFISGFFKKISQSLGIHLESWDEITDLASSDPLVILIDEFAFLKHNKQTAQTFIPQIIDLASAANIRLIVGLQRDVISIEKFIESQNLSNSKFWKYWKTIMLNTLNQEEMIKLLKLLPNKVFSAVMDNFAIVISKTNGHPQKLQYLCKKLMDNYLNENSSKEIKGLINQDDSYRD